MPKKEKKGKAEKMAGKAGKGVDKGLHKGWDATKGIGEDATEAATRKEQHRQHEIDEDEEHEEQDLEDEEHEEDEEWD